MMTAVHVFTAVGRRTWHKTLQHPVTLTFSFVQPIIWMAFFGFLFQGYRIELGRPDVTYLDFLAPGVCAMTVLFGASQSGIGLIRDLQTRFLPRMLGTPAPALVMLSGKLAADVSRLLLQAVAIGTLGALLGARIALEVGPILVALLYLFCFAWALASLSCIIALTTRRQEGMAVFVHLVNLPMLFASTALVPARQMPEWLQSIAGWNPLSLVVDALRDALLLGTLPSHPWGLVTLAALALILFLVAAASALRVRPE